ncbi:hypothetical protein [Nocardia lijiangensis]|uniref:hypothetical protein n=1 Tax=Nocardia lijiangensis TaxID=299618 RepID=UPI003D74B1EC
MPDPRIPDTSWSAQRVAWLRSATPASTGAAAYDADQAGNEGVRVHNFHGMTPTSAARRLERVYARRELTAAAQTHTRTTDSVDPSRIITPTASAPDPGMSQRNLVAAPVAAMQEPEIQGFVPQPTLNQQYVESEQYDKVELPDVPPPPKPRNQSPTPNPAAPTKTPEAQPTNTTPIPAQSAPAATTPAPTPPARDTTIPPSDSAAPQEQLPERMDPAVLRINPILQQFYNFDGTRKTLPQPIPASVQQNYETFSPQDKAVIDQTVVGEVGFAPGPENTTPTTQVSDRYPDVIGLLAPGAAVPPGPQPGSPEAAGSLADILARAGVQAPEPVEPDVADTRSLPGKVWGTITELGRSTLDMATSPFEGVGRTIDQASSVRAGSNGIGPTIPPDDTSVTSKTVIDSAQAVGSWAGDLATGLNPYPETRAALNPTNPANHAAALDDQQRFTDAIDTAADITKELTIDPGVHSVVVLGNTAYNLLQIDNIVEGIHTRPGPDGSLHTPDFQTRPQHNPLEVAMAAVVIASIAFPAASAVERAAANAAARRTVQAALERGATTEEAITAGKKQVQNYLQRPSKPHSAEPESGADNTANAAAAQAAAEAAGATVARPPVHSPLGPRPGARPGETPRVGPGVKPGGRPPARPGDKPLTRSHQAEEPALVGVEVRADQTGSRVGGTSQADVLGIDTSAVINSARQRPGRGQPGGQRSNTSRATPNVGNSPTSTGGRGPRGGGSDGPGGPRGGGSDSPGGPPLDHRIEFPEKIDGVEVVPSENKYLLNHPDSDSAIHADISSTGVLTILMGRNPGSPVSGRQMFDTMMAHFGNRVTIIEGYWVYGDNLKKVNELTAGGVRLRDAVGKAWTAQQAARHGFTEVGNIETVGGPGNYKMISPQFKRR